MTRFICAAMATFIAVMGTTAVSARDCNRAENADGLFCTDRDVRALEKTVETALDRLTASADPLTALLLKRDQRWFGQMFSNDTYGFNGDRTAVANGVSNILRRRLAMLKRIRTGGGETLAGEWINVLGTAAVKQLSKEKVAVSIAASVQSDEFRPAKCALTAELTLRPDGWYEGRPVAGKLESDEEHSDTAERIGDDEDAGAEGPPTVKKAADGPSSLLRLRLQGPTLRVVHDGGVRHVCVGPDMVTGTYFPTGAGPRAGTGSNTVAPSFDCATAKHLDEEEICADPDLARNDAALARLYAVTLRRLDSRLATQLRNDQRAWAKENATVADVWLMPYWDKTYGTFLQPGSIRAELQTRQKERMAMLEHLDDTRRDLAGLWVAHNALVSIEPASGKPAGTLAVKGWKWETGDHKSYCDLDGEGPLVNGAFKPEHDDGPVIRRDGATLMIDGDDPDPDTDGDRQRPSYCRRMESAKARLFPVKAGAEIGAIKYGRIR